MNRAWIKVGLSGVIFALVVWLSFVCIGLLEPYLGTTY